MNLGEAAWFTGFPPSRTHHLAFFVTLCGMGISGRLMPRKGRPKREKQHNGDKRRNAAENEG